MITKIILLYLTLILTTPTTSECILGCQKCDLTKGTCLVCDQTNNFYLTNNKCEKKIVKNCKIYDEGSCLMCNDGYFLEKFMKKCISLDFGVLVENCQSYLKIGECVKCKSLFFLEGNFCWEVSEKIDGCLFYKGSFACEECENGFLMDFGKEKCLQVFRADENCVTRSFVECVGCGQGVLDFNYLKKEIEKNLKSDFQSVNVLANGVYLRESLEYEDGCIIGEIDNCATYSSFDLEICKICKENYFLDDNKCHLYPKESITNCAKYLTESECGECLQNFYLLSKIHCAPIEKIENCELYSTTADETICLKCWSSHFLTANKCKERKNFPNNCTTYSPTQDICTACSSSLTPTSDGKKCLPKIQNCQSYLNSTLKSISLKCQKCNSFYYLSNTFCKLGSIKNCKTYTINTETCIECENDYYLTANICKKHSEIQNCKKYSKNTAKKCLECENTTILLSKITNCKKAFIKGCKKYINPSSCLTCEENYNKIDNYKCEILNPSLNCLRATNDICEKCKKNFLLKNGKCFQPLNYEVKFCDETNITGEFGDHSLVDCEVCVEGAFGFNYKNHFVCVENFEMEVLKGSSLIPWCLGYQKNGGDYECVKCEESFVVKDGSCEANCYGGGDEMVLQRFFFKEEALKFSFEKKDFCVAKTDDCRLMTVGSDDGSGLSSQCLKSENGYYQTIVIGDNKEMFAEGKDIHDTIISKKIFSLPIFQNVDNATSEAKKKGILNSDGLVEDCKFYYELEDKLIGCSVCNFGKYGRILNFGIDFCNEYSDDSLKNCTKCIHDYYDTDKNGKSCTKSNINGCLRFSLTEEKCLLCETGFYLETSQKTCTKNIAIENCQYFSRTSNKCIKCIRGYKLRDITPSSDKADNECKREITNCLIHSINSDKNLQCDECINFYYPKTDGTECLKGTKVHCWKYYQINHDDYALDKCEKYLNKFIFKKNTECKPPDEITPKIDGCITFDYKDASKNELSTICKICNSKTHFLIQNKCCLYNQYLKSGTCTDNTIQNCKINKTVDDGTVCDECDNGYEYFNDPGNEKCCKNGSYYNSGCKDKIELNLNSECSVFDQLTKYCLVCEGDKYKNDKFDEKCCDKGTYYDDGDCETILIENCDRFKDGNCTLCSDLTYTTKNCCNPTTHYDDGVNSCVSLPTGCKEMEKEDGNWRCKTCNDDSYFVAPSYICCIKGKSSTSAKYDDGNGTCIVNSTSPNAKCEQFRSDGKCIKCIDGTVFKNGDECCLDNEYWDGTKCEDELDNLNIFENCIQIDVNDSNKCKLCSSGYYLHLENCVEVLKYWKATPTPGTSALISTDYPDYLECNKINDELTECAECLAKYYLTSNKQTCCPPNTILDSTGDSPKCIPLNEFTLNCAYFDLTTKKCAKIDVDGNDEIQCSGSGDSRFYFNPNPLGFTDQRRCCKEGEFYDKTENLCKTNTTITDCLHPKDIAGSKCLKCADGKTLTTGNLCTGTSMIGCVIQNPVAECDLCKTGFILNYTTNNECEANPGSPTVDYTKHCIGVDSTATKQVCTLCDSFSYSNPIPNFCCPLGYFYNSTANKCKKISNEYCAKSINGEDCTECFISKDHCTVKGNYKWTISNSDYSLTYTKDVGFGNLADADLPQNTNLDTYTENYLGINTKKCCPLGKYYNKVNNVCEDIAFLEIYNCVKYDDDTKKCTQCVDEYELSSELICCRYDENYDSVSKSCIRDFLIKTCKDGFYLSNGKCCTEFYFYDTNLSKCIPLFDPNCKESDSRTNCSVCVDGYQSEKNFSTLVKQDLRTPEHCENLQEKHNVRFCKKDLWFANNIVDYTNLYFLINDCNNFNFTNKRCDVCKENSSKTDGDYCCPESFFAYEEKCREMEDFVSNCYNYDHDTRKCSECKNSYDLYEGICCPQDKFLNIKTFKCEIEKKNCKTFNVKNGVCTECNKNYYFSNYNCCPYGTYYEILTESCETIENSDQEDCKRLGNDGNCDECFNNNSTYIHKGFCCPFGQYYNIDSVNPKNSTCKLSETVFNCKRFDIYDQCLECEVGNYLSNFECCPEGQWYDWTSHVGSKACITKPKHLECKKINNDGTKCLECSTGYLTNDHCCLDTTVWSADDELCISILTNLHCLKLNDNDINKCIKCVSSYYITNDRCCKDGYYYNSNLNFCEKIDSGTLKDANSITSEINVLRYDDTDKIMKCSSNFISDSLGTTCVSYDDSNNYPENCYKLKTNSTCDKCEENYYLSNGNCCSDGKFWDNNNVGCQLISSSNLNLSQRALCGQISTGDSTCTKCLDESKNYLSNSLECVVLGKFWDSGGNLAKDLDDSNCKKGTHANMCTECAQNFILLDTGICDNTINSDPINDKDVPSYLKFCSYKQNINDESIFPEKCDICYPKISGTDRYLTNGSCCPEGKYFDNVNSYTCITIDPSEGFDNCKQINGSKCEECKANFYLTGGHCCKERYFWDTNACIKIINEGLENCLQLDTNNTCNTAAGCADNTHYLTEYHCCEIGKYWNQNFNPNPKCDTISISKNCNKVEQTDHTKCSVCSNTNYYISNGECCTEGFYSPKNSCTSIINRGTCKRIDSNKCQASSKINACKIPSLDHPECCEGDYYTKNSTCEAITTNCSKMNADGDCTECSTGYLTNGKCCADLKYWNGSNCVNIDTNTVPNCDRVADVDLSKSEEPSVCIKCTTSTNLEVRNGNCCLASEFYLTSVSECVPMDLLSTKCLSLNSNGDCTTCINGNYPSNGVCCPEGEYYNKESTVKNCEAMKGNNISCLKLSGNNCLKCEDLYYYNSKISKCCLISYAHNGTDCENDFDKSIENCNGFDDNKICTSCTKGNVLYPTGENHEKICCSKGEFYKGETCQSLMNTTERCSDFNQNIMKCTTCNSDYFLANDFCCLKTHYWDINNKNCDIINLPNCAKQIQIKVLNDISNHCKECKSGYLLNNGCCNFGNYWDEENSSCKLIPILNCKKYDPKNGGKCTECLEDYNYYEVNKKCSPDGKWWNQYNSSYEESIFNCKIYDDIETPISPQIDGNIVTPEIYLKKTLKCKECKSNSYFISVDRESCCKENHIYFTTTNFEDQCRSSPLVTEVFENCTKFNIQETTSKKLVCEKCENNYYVSHGICCPIGSVRVSDSKKCEVVNVPVFQFCNQFDDDDHDICTGCTNEKYLKNDSKECLTFPNCKVFDNKLESSSNLCTECNIGYYLSDGFCCEEGSQRDGSNNSCALILTDNKCMQWNGSNCVKCKDFTYPVMSGNDIDFCCSKGNYCSDATTTELGKIDNCKVYGKDLNDCLKCGENFAVTVLKNDVKYCYPLFIENCKYQKIEVSSSENKLICEECQDQYFLNSITEEDLIKSYNHIYGCIGYDNTNLLKTSTLKCKECGNNKFLKTSLNQICEDRIVSGANTEQNSDINCIEPYVVDKDECRVCKDGFYLSDDNLCKNNNDEDDGCLHKIMEETKGVCKVCGIDNYENYTYLNSEWNKTCPKISTFEKENIIGSPPKYFKAYIENCINNEECLPDYLNGISVELQKYFSCHKCSDKSKIPFVSIQGGVNTNENTGLQRYNILTTAGSTLNTYKENETNYSSQCLKKDLTEFEFKSSSSTTFPSNCGLGIVNGDLEASDTDSGNSNPEAGLSVYCAACEPGYFGSISSKQFHVYQCSEILNCKVKGGAFNQCDECVKNFAFEYIESGINYGKCVFNENVNNCFAYNTVSNNCEYCNKGYSKNKEKKCEIINAPNCTEDKMSFNQPYPFKDIKIAILRGDFGCSKCSENFTGLYQSEDEYICTESTYIKEKSYIDLNPVFDINCLQYANKQEKITCHKCTPTTVLNIQGKCYPAEILPNCIVDITTNSCQICTTSEILINNTCVQKEIKNCKYYSQSSNTQICLTCEKKHYLSENKCEKGIIKNCEIYESRKTDCKKCEDNYQLILVKNNAHYCIPITTHDNCLSFDIINFQNHLMTCEECENGFALENLNSQVDVCNSFSLVDNCISYDKGTNFRNSSFFCNECENGYYLNGEDCVLRNVFVEFCLVYENSEQLCKECEKEYYLNDDKSECLVNPVEFLGCAFFKNKDHCLKCKFGYYLENNICEIVLSDNLINGCISYLYGKICEECNSKTILNNTTNKCETADIPNCLIFKDLTNCETCKEGYGIVKTPEKNQNCDKIPEILFCSTYHINPPFECTKCINNYYLKDNKCLEIVELIENCLIYSPNQLCSKCKSNHILSSNKKKCHLSTFTGNCSFFQEQNTPFCILCKPGYYLNKERKCISDISFDFNSNCLFFNGNVCEMCLIGYFQNIKGECIFNDFDKNKNYTDAMEDNQGDFEDGQGIFGALRWVIFGLLFLF